MSSQKKKIFLAAAAAVLVILLAVVFLSYEPAEQNRPPEQANSNTNQEPEKPKLPEVVEGKDPVSSYASSESGVVMAARNFAERFSSFSSDSGYANLNEAKVLATPKLTRYLDAMIKDKTSNEFYGVSSKVLNVKIESFNEDTGQASASVTLQRQETAEDGSVQVDYKTLELELVGTGNQWLVDELAWK